MGTQGSNGGGIDFAATFGQGSKSQAPASSGSGRQDQPKAKVWINIGYYVTTGDGDQRFVSLPVGIPLDTMEEVSTRSSNDDYRAFQSARNDLLSAIKVAAGELPSGGERQLNLQIQMRRVNEEQAPVETGTNPYALDAATL